MGSWYSMFMLTHYPFKDVYIHFSILELYCIILTTIALYKFYSLKFLHAEKEKSKPILHHQVNLICYQQVTAMLCLCVDCSVMSAF